MENYDDIDALINGLLAKRKKICDRILDEMNKASKKTLKDTEIEFGKYQQEVISKMFTDAVDYYYGDYHPDYYKRRKSMYNILDMKPSDTGVVIREFPSTHLYLLDGNKMKKGRNGYDLFKKVFIDGYHGGAESISPGKAEIWGHHPNPGVPYYRRPGWIKLPNSSRKEWYKYAKWGRVAAVCSPSPYEMFASEMDEAIPGYIAAKNKEILTKNNKISFDKVSKLIPKLEKEIYG